MNEECRRGVFLCFEMRKKSLLSGKTYLLLCKVCWRYDQWNFFNSWVDGKNITVWDCLTNCLYDIHCMLENSQLHGTFTWWVCLKLAVNLICYIFRQRALTSCNFSAVEQSRCFYGRLENAQLRLGLSVCPCANSIVSCSILVINHIMPYLCPCPTNKT